MRVYVKVNSEEQFFIEMPVLPRIGDEIFLHTESDGNHSYKVTDVIFYAKRVDTATGEDVYLYDNSIVLFVDKKY